MLSRNKKLVTSQAHKVSTTIKGKILAAAFVLVRREGLHLRVASIDHKAVQQPLNIDGCVSVDVVDGFVRRCWID
jgi:hypothetical protein